LKTTFQSRKTSRCKTVARSLQKYLVAVFDLNEEQ